MTSWNGAASAAAASAATRFAAATVSLEQLDLRVHRYATDLTQEHFLHFVTNERYAEPGLIAGFLRLSLPTTPRAAAAPSCPRSPATP